MVWHQAGLVVFTAFIIAGCASAPIDMESEKDVNHAVDDGSVASKDDLDAADPGGVRRCKEKASTGSRVVREVCGPEKDDSALLGVIGVPGDAPPSDSN